MVLFWLDMLSLFGLKKFPLKSAGFLTMAFSAEVEVIFAAKFSEGFCCLDWALCRSCLYVELQLLGCTVCCQVFPVFWLQICLNELLLCFCFSRALISSAKSFLKGPTVLDWALCRSCLCVELQSPGCTVCCQVPPNVCLQISSKELLLMSNLSVLLLIFLHTEFYSRLYKFRNL